MSYLMNDIENRTIFERDNLDILRVMDSESVDLIYLDPPFNSKKKYQAPLESEASGAEFKDTWYMSDVKQEWIDHIHDHNEDLWFLIEASGRNYDESMKAYLIMMSVRLIEMQRILKSTGSIYLHCNDVATHYLRSVLDSIFGKENFRNEIIWGYRGGGVPKKAFARKHDTLIFYSKTKKSLFNPQYMPYSDSTQKLVKKRGGVSIDGKKRNLDRGATMNDYWSDINSLQTWSPERIGYPTQKPVELLKRVIKASSDPENIILDPFCGCATTCVAAENLNRKWIGIDLSSKAIELVRHRLTKEVGMFGEVNHRTDIPQNKTEITEQPKKLRRKQKFQILFEQQKGVCNGCFEDFSSPVLRRNLEIDHIKPKSQGRDDSISNLQLLCAGCNGHKSDGTMFELYEKNVKAGFYTFREKVEDMKRVLNSYKDSKSKYDKLLDQMSLTK